MKTVIEGMAACTEVKSGSVELADVCKRILPIAGTVCVLYCPVVLCVGFVSFSALRSWDGSVERLTLRPGLCIV